MNMNQRNGLIIGVIVVALLVGGGLFFMTQKKTSAPQPQTTTQTATENQNTSMFSSFKDLLSKNTSVECNYTDEQGRQTKSYIKNGSVRVDMVAANPQDGGSVILKDKTMYVWGGEKEGFMMTISDIEDLQKNVPTGALSAQSNIAENIEKYKESCKEASVDDSHFVVPTDIKFTDMSQILKMAPSGTQAYPSMDQKKVEEMMKQYNPQ